MTINRFKLIGLAALFLLPLTFIGGCARGIIFEMVNESARHLVLYSYDVKGRSEARPVRTGQSTKMPCPSKLKITFEGGEWNYVIPAFPLTYVSRTIKAIETQRVLIDRNGELSLLMPKSSGSHLAVPAQPPGFPLRPQ